MTLVDTSVWVDHFRRGSAGLASLLGEFEVLWHPFVVGELACGTLKRRTEILSLLTLLPQAPLGDHDDVLSFVEAHHLAGAGLGWIDVHLLSSASRSGATLWTPDRRLATAARRTGVSAPS
jgi:predicted nucleic acid-binding protein